MKIGREFLSFAAVGVVGLVVDLAVLYVLAPRLGWYGARALSFLAAATTTWALNRRFTFGSRRSGASLLREYVAYLVTMIGGAIVNYGVYVLTLHWLAQPWAPALGVALGSLAGLAVNFSSARRWVFGTKARR